MGSANLRPIKPRSISEQRKQGYNDWLDINLNLAAIWEWFPLFTMIPGLGHSELMIKFTQINDSSSRLIVRHLIRFNLPTKKWHPVLTLKELALQPSQPQLDMQLRVSATPGNFCHSASFCDHVASLVSFHVLHTKSLGPSLYHGSTNPSSRTKLGPVYKRPQPQRCDKKGRDPNNHYMMTWWSWCFYATLKKIDKSIEHYLSKMLLFYLSRDCNYISPAIKPFWDNKKWPNSIRHSSDIAVRSLYSNLSDKHGDDRRDVSPRDFFLTWDIPSGNLLYSYWKWPSRNSGWLPIIAMVIFFPSFLLTFTRG